MLTSGTRIEFGELLGARVLVTGARGFIGAHLCSRLGGLGAEVYGTSRAQCPDAAPHVRWIVTGLDDAQEVRKLLLSVKPNVIFHLAGPTSASRNLAMVLPTFQGALLTTVNLLTVAAENGCRRIVLAGSLEAERGGRWSASSPYAAAKEACYMYARMFSELYAAPVTVARIFMTYGPGQSDVRKLVPYVILSLLRGDVPKIGNGARAIDWVYIDDLIEGLLRLAVAPGLVGDSVDLGTGRTFTVRWVVDKLVQLTGSSVKPEFGALADRPFEVVATADLADTEAKIDWVPRTSIEDGLKSTVESYRTSLRAEGPLR